MPATPWWPTKPSCYPERQESPAPAVPPTADEAGTYSGICARIGDRQTPYGVLCAYSSGQQAFSRGDACFLAAVANIVAAAIERDRAQQALRQRQYLLDQSQEIAHLGSWSWHLASGRVEWSAETYRLFGLRREQLDGGLESVLARIHPQDRERIVELTDKVQDVRRAGKEWRQCQPPALELRIVRPDGEERQVHVVGEMILDERGAPLRMAGIVHDVSDQRALEEQLRQAQKMETLGQLASGISHDFNNLLMAILINCELLAGKSHDDDLNRRISEIRQAAERARDLTQQLQRFSRKQAPQATVLNLNEVVVELSTMLARLIGEHIAFETRLDPSPEAVRVDRGHLQQVLTNLVVNARDAMPGGGKLRLEVSSMELDQKQAERRGLAAGPYVVLTVIDSGHGMSAEVLRHIFEPFFTTKGRDEGTGLGLATAYGIIRQSGGHIEAESEPERGTTFRIYLPRAPDSAITVAPEASKGAVLTGGETILLVEDDEAVREAIRRTLEELGYQVLEAGDHLAAREWVERHAGAIDLLIADVVLPELSGPHLARQLRAVRPEMKTLYMSGYSQQDLARLGLLDPDLPVLSKPTEMKALAVVVREILEPS